MTVTVDEVPRLLLRIDLEHHVNVAPVHGRRVLWGLYLWHKVIEMQSAYCFNEAGDARKVSLGQQTLDADGGCDRLRQRFSQSCIPPNKSIMGIPKQTHC